MNFLTPKLNKELLTGIILSLAAVFFVPYPWIGIGLIIAVLLFGVLEETEIILLTIFSFLLLSSSISDTLRLVSNAAITVILGYLFVKKYGIHLSAYPHIQPKVILFIIFLVILMLFSSLFSGNTMTGMVGTGRQVIFFLIWFILFSFLRKETDAFKYTGALIASGAGVAITIIYSFISSGQLFLLESQGIVHEGGVYSNVTAAGGILDVSIPLTFALILYYARDKKYLFLLTGLIMVQLAGLFLTNSRESIMAAILSCTILFFILKRKWFYQVIIFSTGSLILVLLTSSAFLNMIEVYFRVNRILENTRYYLWDITLKIIRDNPVWGVGPGQFKNQMYNHLNVMLGSWEEKQIEWIYNSSGMGESHNFLLFRTVELGIGGFISAILLPILFFYYSRKVIRYYASNKKVYYLAIGIFSTGIGLFIRSLFEATGLISHGWISRDLPFWLCFAIILFLYNKKPGLVK